MGAAAELERGMIAARLRTGRRRKRERGGCTGGPAVPFGQRVEGEGRDARLVADPAHASTVATILQLRRSGLTLAAIAQRSTPRGSRPREAVAGTLRACGACSARPSWASPSSVPSEKYGKSVKGPMGADVKTNAVPDRALSL